MYKSLSIRNESATIFTLKGDLYGILINIPQLPSTIIFLLHLLNLLPTYLQSYYKYLSYTDGTFLVLIDGKNDDPQKILYYGFL